MLRSFPLPFIQTLPAPESWAALCLNVWLCWTKPWFCFYSRVCGRKRKGTPVKVCDRAYVTEDEEEESMSEHSYSPGIYRHTHTHILPHAVGVFLHSGAYRKQVLCCSHQCILVRKHLLSFEHKACCCWSCYDVMDRNSLLTLRWGPVPRGGRGPPPSTWQPLLPARSRSALVRRPPLTSRGRCDPLCLFLVWVFS